MVKTIFMKKQLLLLLVLVLVSCKQKPSDSNVKSVIEKSEEEIEEVITITAKQQIEILKSNGFEVFSYQDEQTMDTIIMQQYFIAFLKIGKIRTQNEEEAVLLQKQHLKHLRQMYDLGFADISGPFGDDGDIRGITIYNVPSLKMADSLANSDPMVKAKRLEIEIHPWWAAKGFQLR